MSAPPASSGEGSTSLDLSLILEKKERLILVMATRASIPEDPLMSEADSDCYLPSGLALRR
jgi:hypothetical protein